VLGVIRQYWGFDSLRPIQEEAIRVALKGRDSLVVMPTGGGKSLCYQAPAALQERMTVVVSPLISLMKDQVDGLKLAGYPAGALYTGMRPRETEEVEGALAAGELKLLFLAPERLLNAGMLTRLAKLDGGGGVQAFAIDEAHCISQWGHDFRPEYRRLAELREIFPSAAFNAFTATATERVREDIVAQLRLRDPAVLVGVFDRPNLTYRVVPKVRLDDQVMEAVARHSGGGEQSGATIVYCISRKETEFLAGMLKSRGVAAAAYHAGLEPRERSRVQEDFSQERLNVVVATVAFGMGIDRSNVRCVVHAGLPKSVEGYQQETGRAGRDGLPSECVLIYSGQDAQRWKEIMTRSAAETEGSEESLRVQMGLLDQMQRFAAGAVCRHKGLSEYFGQEYAAPARAEGDETRGCGACDVCLGDLGDVADADAIAKKILSCVARVDQRFGAAHVVDVLRGSRIKKIVEWKHDQLSTFGLLRDVPRPVLLGYVSQLLDQEVLERSPGEYPVLVLNEKSVRVMRGELKVSLLEPRSAVLPTEVATEASPLSSVEAALFDALKAERLAVARERGVPPYLVFHDTVLRELAVVRPSRVEVMRKVKGVGEKKAAELGPRFCEFVVGYCGSRGLEMDQEAKPVVKVRAASAPVKPAKLGEASGVRGEYFRRYAAGMQAEEVATEMGKSLTTAMNYLAEFILETKPGSVERWVDEGTYGAIADFAKTLKGPRLKDVFEGLKGKYSYDAIQVVMAHLRGMGVVEMPVVG